MSVHPATYFTHTFAEEVACASRAILLGHFAVIVRVCSIYVLKLLLFSAAAGKKADPNTPTPNA
jgi:hypothetical protein